MGIVDGNVVDDLRRACRLRFELGLGLRFVLDWSDADGGGAVVVGDRIGNAKGKCVIHLLLLYGVAIGERLLRLRLRLLWSGEAIPFCLLIATHGTVFERIRACVNEKDWVTARITVTYGSVDFSVTKHTFN
jgi:hypothetical protein